MDIITILQSEFYYLFILFNIFNNTSHKWYFFICMKKRNNLNVVHSLSSFLFII
ncbi:hypothetical protein H238_0215 [Klebsiella pneumoniae UHKPC179]|nr:hypothetical protein H238_0215 [Klebsiella pneumoniae UHKPC179]